LEDDVLLQTGAAYDVEDSNKHIIEEIVRQVGHLPDLSTM
jgi:hypothetical protein